MAFSSTMEGVCSAQVQAQNKQSRECVRCEGEMNKRKLGSLALCAMLLALCLSAQAQQPTKVPRIGFLYAGSPSDQLLRVEAFRQGLRELGYMEGKNIVVEYRHAEGKYDRLPVLVAELVRLKVDVIVTGGGPATRSAKEATKMIPIVMAQDTDPVGSGFVASLARPGGNITGLATLAPEMGGKQLGLLKEIAPKVSRVAVIGNSSIPGDAQALRETVLAAGAYEIYLRYLDVVDPKYIEATFLAAAKGRSDGLLVLGNPNLNAHRKQIVELAVKHRLPATYTRPEYIDAGGLMYYGTNYSELFRRAATYVDKILKGAKAADLPVEQPKKSTSSSTSKPPSKSA
jgi:putative tryptophan/tyrosine transport system substrate-binding protein